MADAAVFFVGAAVLTAAARWLGRPKTPTEAKFESRRLYAVLPTAGTNEVLVHKVEHLADHFPDAATFPSPLLLRTWPRNNNFVQRNEYTLSSQSFLVGAGARAGRLIRSHSQGTIDVSGREGAEPSLSTPPAASLASAGDERPVATAFATAGPCPSLAFDPANTRIAIATCGGLCPGLNTVIREVVMCGTYVYGIPLGNIFGVHDGYRGFYGAESAWQRLTPESVSRIHTMGGTILGSSRGGMEPDRILDGLVAHRIDIVVLIGGDGTHRGAALVQERARDRGLRLSVACVPKTVDNDIGLIDRSFGFQTAVELAVHPINCAHTEALSTLNGVGLVKLMGRSAGFIALYASLASRDVNVCLVPEAPWRLSALCAHIEARLKAKGHAVIVVAEGAESVERKAELEAEAAAAAAGGHSGGARTDESGNPVLEDVSEYIKAGLSRHFKSRGLPLNLKAISPSYIVRSQAANAADSDLCTQLAFNVLHGAMGGYTSFTVGTVDNVCVWIPVAALNGSKPRRVDPTSRVFARLMASTGQPQLLEGL